LIVAVFFLDGLTDGQTNGTWRALGFAYAAIFFLGNTLVYVAKTPVQTRKLFYFMAALMLGPYVLFAVDGHGAHSLLEAMFLSPLAVMNTARLNPRYIEYFGLERAAHWKTALRKSAGWVVVSCLLLVIIFHAREPRKLDPGPLSWLETLVLVIPACLTIVMIGIGPSDGTLPTDGAT
jgi:hypothetical protein